jgi:hypothetical protein
MIRFIIFLIIAILLYNSLLLSLNKPCLKERETITINKLHGSVIPFDNNDLLDLKLKLDINVPCGIYKLFTHYGPALLIVGGSEENIGILNFIDVTDQKLKIPRFEMWDVKRLTSFDNDFINTYNKGCCFKK